MGSIAAASRRVFRDKYVALFTVVLLSIGIGGLTGVYSIIRGILHPDSPVLEEQGLVALRTLTTAGELHPRVAYGEYLDLKESISALSDIAAYSSSFTYLTTPNGTTGVVGAYVTSNFFNLLGVTPALGRSLMPSDSQQGAVSVAWIGQRLFHRDFAGDPQVLGTTIRINQRPHTVVGVMPEGFAFPYRQEVWVPLRLDPSAVASQPGPPVFVVGRLEDDVTLAEATAEISSFQRDPGTSTEESWHFLLDDYFEAQLAHSLPVSLYVIFGALGSILVITCANLATILVARTMQRMDEVAVRIALGSSRLDIFGLFIWEAALLTLLGTVGGTLIALSLLQVFDLFIGPGEPLRAFWINPELDSRALLFCFAASLAASLAAVLLPAVHATRSDPREMLTGYATASRTLALSRSLRLSVWAQIVLTTVVLVAASLFVGSLTATQAVSRGFEPTGILTARVSLLHGNYPDDRSRIRLYEALLDDLAGLPEVRAVALSSGMPGNPPPDMKIYLPGSAPHGVTVSVLIVTPDFFEVFGVRRLQGRGFEGGGGSGEKKLEIVVSQSFARKYLETGTSIGQTVYLTDQVDRNSGEDRPATVVGVVDDVSFEDLSGATGAREVVYFSLARFPQNSLFLTLRTGTSPLTVYPVVRRRVTSIDSALALYEAQSMKQVVKRETWLLDTLALLFTGFGAIAVLVSTTGLYGTMAFTVTERAHELGVRAALGAGPRHLARFVLREAFGLIVVGLACGLPLARAVSHYFASLVVGVGLGDWKLYAVSIAVVVTGGLLASVGPTRRAARMAPSRLLR